jgi:hypothetical protein
MRGISRTVLETQTLYEVDLVHFLMRKGRRKAARRFRARKGRVSREGVARVATIKRRLRQDVATDRSP